MGWFKRLCLFVFGLAGVLAFAALVLPWVGPYTQQATDLITTNLDYWYAVLVVAGITALGTLICLLRAIFTPRNRKVVMVNRVDGGEITVTRNAIASQAKHIVESDGTCVAAGTHVRAGKRAVWVRMKVTPKKAMNVVQKGEELHNQLVRGLAGICGDTLKDVSLEFTDPQSFDDQQPDYLSTTYAGYSSDEGDEHEPAAVSTYVAPAEDDDESLAPAPVRPLGGITVPLHAARHDAEEGSSVAADSTEQNNASTTEAQVENSPSDLDSADASYVGSDTGLGTEASQDVTTDVGTSNGSGDADAYSDLDGDSDEYLDPDEYLAQEDDASTQSFGADGDAQHDAPTDSDVAASDPSAEEPESTDAEGPSQKGDALSTDVESAGEDK